MAINTDFAGALVGADLSTIRDSARDVLAAIPKVETKAELQYLCRQASEVATALQQKAAENVNVASKAGFLPSRYLGIDSNREFPAGILAGGTVDVNVRPSVDVRIIGFRMDETFAGDFSVRQINVATIQLIVGEDSLPASMFVSGIMLPPMAAPKLTGGSSAQVSFVNVSGAARRARAGFPIIKLSDPGC